MTRRVLDRLADSGVVAVLRGVDADRAVDVASALSAGGVTGIELTADTPGALEGVSRVADAVDGAAVGVGTVRDAETASAAVRAGAEFVVSPHLAPDVVETCNRHGVLVAPGALTPSEISRAIESGADLVKIFPAGTVGPAYLRSLRGPLPNVPLMPTGGVGLDSVEAFVAAGAAVVGAGSALVGDADSTDAIEGRAREFVAAVERARD